MSDTLKNFDWALAQLRHLYIQHNLNEGLKTGLLGPQIECLEEVRNDLHALTERLRAVEAERDEANTTIGNLQKPLDHIAKLIWGDTQGRPFAILGEAVATQLSALRAELARKDAALKELCKDEPLVEPEWIESDNHGDIRSNASDITRWHLAKIARAALQPKEPPCKTA